MQIEFLTVYDSTGKEAKDLPDGNYVIDIPAGVVRIHNGVALVALRLKPVLENS